MARRDQDDPFAGFHDVRPIGEGAFASVYRGTDAATGAAVALKVLHPAGDRRVDADVLALEARALGTVSDHPNIVTLHRAFVRADGHPVLVLELCETSLAGRLRAHGPLPVREAVSIAVKLAGALETAHRAGILHRDLKPSNVLVTAYGEPVLADFGIAGLRELTSGGSQLSGLTVHHAAPEVLLGAVASATSDIYGLASTVHELIDGHAPFFVTTAEAPAEVQRRILSDRAPRLAATSTPPALRDLLRRCLAKDPAERPPSAMAFAQELRAVEDASGWPRTPCRIDRVPDLPPPPPRRAPTPPPGAAAVTDGGVRLGLPARPLGDVAPVARDLEPRPAANPRFLPGRSAPLLPIPDDPPQEQPEARG